LTITASSATNATDVAFANLISEETIFHRGKGPPAHGQPAKKRLRSIFRARTIARKVANAGFFA